MAPNGRLLKYLEAVCGRKEGCPPHCELDLRARGTWPESRRALLVFYAQLGEQEGVAESDLRETVIAARRAAVSRSHVGLEQQEVRVGLRRPQLGSIFSGIP